MASLPFRLSEKSVSLYLPTSPTESEWIRFFAARRMTFPCHQGSNPFVILRSEAAKDLYVGRGREGTAASRRHLSPPSRRLIKSP